MILSVSRKPTLQINGIPHSGVENGAENYFIAWGHLIVEAF